MAKGSKTKDEVEEDLELEELDEDVESEGKSKAQEVTFGVADLAKYLTKKTGKNISTRDLRTQIRRMAREDKPRVQREITAGNRTRYDWPEGLKDPEVKAIIKAVTGGELEEGKKAALTALKEKKAAQKAAGEGGGKKGKKGKKGKSAPVVEDDDDDDDLEEIEDDDDE